MAKGGADVRQLLLQVDASVELARSKLGQLANQVQVDSARMDRSLASVDGAFTRLGGVAGKVTGVLAGLGIAVGVNTFIDLGRRALEFGDNLAAAAEQAGIGVERYQTLKGSLRALEVEGTKADKAFKVLQGTLGDVQNGAENGATKALDRLGISSKILSGEIDSTDELLDALAEASKRAGSQAQFTADMVDIFGKKVGVEMANALRDGGVALHQGEADLRAYGTVLTEEMVDRLAEANESIDATLEQASYHFAIFASNAIGAIKAVIAWYRQLPDLSGGAAGLIPKVGMLAPFGTALELYDRYQRNAPARAPTLTGTAKELARARANLQAAQRRAAGGEDYTAARDVQMARQEVERLTGQVRAEARPAPSPSTPKPFKPGRISGGGGGRKRGGGGGGKAKKPDLTRKSLASLEEGLRPWERLDEGLPNFIANLDIEKPLTDLLGVNAATLDLQGLIAGLPPLPDMGKMLTVEDQERLEGFIESFKHDLAGGLADAIVNGEDLGDVLVNSIKRAAAALIESGILELLAQLGTALGGKGSGEGELISTIFASIKGRASGGPVSAGTPYIVGERGRELFVPKVPGTIVPNHRLGGGGPQRLDVFVHHNDELLEVRIARTAGMVVHQAAPGIAATAAAQTVGALTRPALASGIR